MKPLFTQMGEAGETCPAGIGVVFSNEKGKVIKEYGKSAEQPITKPSMKQ